MEDPVLVVWGGVSAACATGIYLWLRRRRFYRTTSGGTEQYKNFSSLIVSNIVEWVASLIAAGFMIAALFLFGYGVYG